MKLAIFEKITKNPLDFDYICYDTIAIHVSVQKCSLKYRGSSTNHTLRTSQSYSGRPAVFYLYLIIHFQAGNKNSEQPGLPIVTGKIHNTWILEYTILEYLKFDLWPPQIKILQNPKDLWTGLTSGVYFWKGVCKTCLKDEVSPVSTLSDENQGSWLWIPKGNVMIWSAPRSWKGPPRAVAAIRVSHRCSKASILAVLIA